MNFDMSFFNNICIPLACAFCLILGFILIKWIPDKNNKYIPTILAFTGAILGCIINSGITIENIVQGAFSGLASTGMHQLFKQFIDK